MSVNGKGFCEEISKIVFTLEPGDYEVTLSYAITNPMKIHVDALLVRRGVMVSLAMPTAQALSQKIEVGG